MIERNFTLIKISMSGQSTEQSGRAKAILFEASPVSQLLGINEDVCNYIRRISGTQFLIERIFTADSGRFWQICKSHVPADIKQDTRYWTILKNGQLYTVTIGPNWFIPTNNVGMPQLLNKKELYAVRQDFTENIKKSRAYISQFEHAEEIAFFPQEFYIPIRADEFVKLKPLTSPAAEQLSIQLWEISKLLQDTKKIRGCARKLLLLLAAFLASKSQTPIESLRRCADESLIRQKYTKEEAVNMFFTTMNTLLMTVIAYSRVAIEISGADTSKTDEAGRFVDCENWTTMADYAIRNRDARVRVIANQFIKNIEDAESACMVINRLAEAVSIYQGLSEVVEQIPEEDNEKLLLASLDDSEALEGLVERAQKNFQKVAAIDERISKDFSAMAAGLLF